MNFNKIIGLMISTFLFLWRHLATFFGGGTTLLFYYYIIEFGHCYGIYLFLKKLDLIEKKQLDMNKK